MTKADRKSANRQHSPADPKTQIESALEKAPGIHETKVFSVRKLHNGNIRVQALTEEQAKLLLVHGMAVVL
jgi:hypothetical protein